jgi:hypothetical protein
MDTDCAKRWAREKGHVSYNPNQSFLIQCQWILPNMSIAHEMIEGLRKCAVATERDTPPVVCYIFRVSHDQSLADDMRQSVRTISQHPHYAKGYKMMDMNMTKEFVISKCQREGISALPFEADWPRDEPIDSHASEFNFDPVVIDLTELYLDNRSMVNHACSKDYMEGYGILLAPHRSLQPHTVVVGSPTEGMWGSLLEPILKARKVEALSGGGSLERLVLNIPTATPSEQHLHHVFLDVDVVRSEGADVSDFIDKLRDVLRPVYQGVVMNHQQSAYRILQACMLDTFINAVTVDGLLSAEAVDAMGVRGRLFIFPMRAVEVGCSSGPQSTEQAAVNDDTNHLLEILQQHISGQIEIVFHDSSSTRAEGTAAPSYSSWWTGYALHCKYAELRPDESVSCKEIPN